MDIETISTTTFPLAAGLGSLLSSGFVWFVECFMCLFSRRFSSFLEVFSIQEPIRRDRFVIMDY